MKIERLGVSVFTVPTEQPESDGTLAWSETTVVVVEPTAGGVQGPRHGVELKRADAERYRRAA